jgi:hypothetical protein
MEIHCPREKLRFSNDGVRCARGHNWSDRTVRRRGATPARPAIRYAPSAPERAVIAANARKSDVLLFTLNVQPLRSNVLPQKPKLLLPKEKFLLNRINVDCFKENL